VVDKTKVAVEEQEAYVWVADVEVSPDRSDLDALLVLKKVLKNSHR
jgi:transposase-like protein